MPWPIHLVVHSDVYCPQKEKDLNPVCDNFLALSSCRVPISCKSVVLNILLVLRSYSFSLSFFPAYLKMPELKFLETWRKRVVRKKLDEIKFREQ